MPNIKVFCQKILNDKIGKTNFSIYLKFHVFEVLSNELHEL